MKSTGLKNRAWQLAAMLVVLIAGLSFASCASDDGEDKEASPIIGTWMAEASSTGTYYMQFTEYKQYFFKGSNTEEGGYTFSNNTLTLNPKGKAPRTYNCKFKGDHLFLTLASGKEGELQFIRYTPTKSVKRVKR